MPTLGLKPQPDSAERAFSDDRQAGCAHYLQYFHTPLRTRNSPKLLFSFPTSAWYRQDLRLAVTHSPCAEKSNAPLPAAGSGLTASLWKNGTQKASASWTETAKACLNQLFKPSHMHPSYWTSLRTPQLPAELLFLYYVTVLLPQKKGKYCNLNLLLI